MAGDLDTWADSGNPFGFETNIHPLEYEYCKKEPGWYREHGYSCSSAPRPHPDLQEYALQFVEDVGLCSIAGSTNSGIGSPRFNRAGGYITVEVRSWDSRLKNEINSSLKEIGVEQNQKNVKQLARILETYLSQNPIYGKRFKSGDTYAALKDAFGEMKKKWLVADQPDLLIEWTRNLKRIIEKDIRSDSGNKFETFKRQISKKYGPSPAPDSVQDGSVGATSIIEETEGELLTEYRKGYHWHPEKGFDGLGDVEGIRLSRTGYNEGARISIYFWLVTFNKCLEKIEEKGDQAF